MKNILLAISLLVVAFPSSSAVPDDAPPRAVLVTGASSGIGLQITELLSANGYLVYAGARKEEDLKRLEAMDNVESVRLDVTVQSDIDAAVVRIQEDGNGLHGLVNNAGIVSAGPLIEVPIGELESLFDVNVYGPCRITQAFAPLIIESKGRIVNISSIAGINSGNLNGHYGMSKHALEAFTDTLALEMDRFDVKVIAVEPGPYATEAVKTLAKRFEENAIWNENSAYKNELEGTKLLLDIVRSSDTTTKGPDDVAQAVMLALFSESPKQRYLVVPNAQTARSTIGKAMQTMLQLNQDQAYSMSRKELIMMLDQELNKLD